MPSHLRTCRELMTPGAIAPTICIPQSSVSDWFGRVGGLVYLVAFELERFDLRYELGTEHPELGWSSRPPVQLKIRA